MPEDPQARQDVAVLRQSVEDCQVHNLSRLCRLEADVSTIRTDLNEHCHSEAIRRARAETVRTIVVAVVAALASLGGAVAGVLLK